MYVCLCVYKHTQTYMHICVSTHSTIKLQNTWNVYTPLINRMLGRKVKTKKFTAAALCENI